MLTTECWFSTKPECWFSNKFSLAKKKVRKQKKIKSNTNFRIRFYCYVLWSSLTVISKIFAEIIVFILLGGNISSRQQLSFHKIVQLSKTSYNMVRLLRKKGNMHGVSYLSKKKKRGNLCLSPPPTIQYLYRINSGLNRVLAMNACTILGASLPALIHVLFFLVFSSCIVRLP